MLCPLALLLSLLWGPPLAAPPAGPAQEGTHVDNPVDRTGDGLAFVELTGPGRTVYVGEHVPITLRIGLRQDLVQDQLLQLFVRELDVPVLVRAPWFDAPSRAKLVDAWDLGTPLEGVATSMALNGDPVTVHRRAFEDREGSTYHVFELQRTITPTRTPNLVIDAPSVRFARATTFREDLFDGRVPVDREDVVVSGNALQLTVARPPEAGRPSNFIELVGTYALTASASPRQLDVGDSVQLILEISGTGGTDGLVPPRLSLRDFRVLGERTEPTEGGVRVVYDLRPLDASVREIPPVEVSVFDPSSAGGYVTLRTDALPIEVSPGEPELVPPSPADPPPPGPAPSGLVLFALPAIALVGLGLLLGVLLVRLRRRSASDGTSRPGDSDPTGDPEGIGTIEARFLARLTEYAGTDLATAGSALGDRLRAGGLRDDLASRGAALHELHEAVRYGGATADDLEARMAAWIEDAARTS